MEEKKLTDEDIIKALECCSETTACDKCPYFISKIDCVSKQRSEKDYLDLIHRLQDENERLTEENEILKGNPPMCVGRSNGKTIRAKLLAFDKMKEQNSELRKQVDELKEENGKLVTIGNGFALERNNLREELDELKKSGNGVLLTSLYKKQADDHKRGLSVQRAYWKKKVEQSVKDTAKEIADWLVNTESDKENLAKIIKEHYGVEVE